MATVEVSHKAASVHSSSKITDSYVASFPGLPQIIAFSILSRHFRDHQRFFRTSIEVWQKVLESQLCMTSHKSLIASKILTDIHICMQHLLPSLATLCNP